MRKKIVILSLTLGFGGIEKYISSLCKMFKDDFEVEIICNYKEQEEPAFDFYNAKISYLINCAYSDISIKQLIKEKKIISILKEVYKRIKYKYQEKYLMIKRLKKLECDYIITTRIKHNNLVNKYIKSKKIIKIATEHNSCDIETNYDIALIKSVSKFDYLVLVSDELKRHYSNLMDSNKCIFIPNVIDNLEREKSDLKKKNIISVGRFSPEKGFVDLIRVMNEVVKIDDDIKLYLIGDGYQKKLIEKMLDENNLYKNIVLTGYKRLNEQKKYYLNSSLYVMPSFSESFGIVLLESMNYGVPCIAFDTALGAKTILNEAGLPVIKGRNIKKMAEVIVGLLQDREELIKLQEKGKNYVKRYDINNVKKQWFSLLQNK